MKSFTQWKTPIPGITKTPIRGIGDEAYFVTASGPGTTLNVSGFLWERLGPDKER